MLIVDYSDYYRNTRGIEAHVRHSAAWTVAGSSEPAELLSPFVFVTQIGEYSYYHYTTIARNKRRRAIGTYSELILSLSESHGRDSAAITHSSTRASAQTRFRTFFESSFDRIYVLHAARRFSRLLCARPASPKTLEDKRLSPAAL